MPDVRIGTGLSVPSKLNLWNGSSFYTPNCYVWDGMAFEKVWPLLELHDPVQQTINTVATGITPPSWWRNGIDYFDYIILGGGGEGGAAGGGTGGGGAAGNVTTGTVQTLGGSMSVVVGSGGSGNNTTGASGNPSYISITGVGTLDTAAGGAGGRYGGSSGSAVYGQSPGTINYQGMTLVGGAQQTTNGAAGNAPGGGSAGVSAIFTYGKAGGAGAVMIQWRQNTSQ